MSGGTKWQRWKKKKMTSSTSSELRGGTLATGKCSPGSQSAGSTAMQSSSASRQLSSVSSSPSSSLSPSSSSLPSSSTSGPSKAHPQSSSFHSKKRKKSRMKDSASHFPGSTNRPQSMMPTNEHLKRTIPSSSDSVDNETSLRTHNVSSVNEASCSDGRNITPKKSPPDLPGFYYDEEKKRYFRILPGHNNVNAVTPETIRQKEAEKKRAKILEQKASSHLVDRSPHGKRVPPKSMLQYFTSKQKGTISLAHYQRLARENAVKHMEVKPTSEVTPFPDRYFDGESGYISRLELDKKQKHVLMVISDDYLSRLWQGEIVCVPNPQTEREELTIANWTTVNILTTRNCMVTHASWAQMGDGKDLYALYAISGGTTSSVQLFKCPSGEDGISHISYRYESNHEMAWTCAWSNSPTLPAHLAIGSTRKALVVDTLSASRQKLHTCHSDVFSQVFSRKSPVLYNGTRRGEVLGVDLRIPSHSHVDMTAVLRHNVSVCSIQLLRDENYLVAGDLGGEIKLWDVRKGSVVQEFKGHHNENYHLPVMVDFTESILYAVGQDKYTRFWSLKTGELLHTIPCPSACQDDHPPAAIYSQKYSCQGRPGLFLGQERQIQWYPMR
ncbi:DDB1- and CUL4-associated factor 4-like [Diadema setosum]|uniref:DDB1- and CUL4-associated factor 4-like n=1 Tax=Diadema setosum TaxID=31175 RepID=UPI003B3A16A8